MASAKVAFPISVGPFTMVPVQLAPALNGWYELFGGFPKPDPTSGATMMAGWDLTRLNWGRSLLERVRRMEEVYSQFSPLYQLTLDDETKVAARIPVLAKYFAWAYPAVLDPRQNYSEAPPDQLAFLQYGGFVYFDDSGTAVGTNGIVPAEVGTIGLSFGCGQPLPEAVANTLTQQGRFQEITLDSLLAEGATHFAWIRPEEFIEQLANPNGSFAYKFEGKPNRYFPVVTKPTFTKDIVNEELEDSESWVVLRCSRPPCLDQLVVLEHGLSEEAMKQRCPDIQGWLSPGQVRIYRDSEYRNGRVARLEDWHCSTSRGTLADPWVFELVS